MCRQVTCRTCGKATWAGCGQHVEQALQGVPARDRCQGHEQAPARKGLLSRLVGR